MRTLYFAAVVSASFFCFLAYSQRSQIGYLPYFHTCANLECRLVCCMRLAEIQDAKITQKIAICVTSHNFNCRAMAIALQLRHISITGKNLLNSNIFSTYPHSMVNVSPLMAEIDSVVWGTPANFNGFRVLASLLRRRRSTEVNQTLHDV